MDAQTIIDTATSASATVIGSAEASTNFRNTLKSSLKVTVNLLPKQVELIKTIVDFPLLFVGGKCVTNDHPVLVALRDLCRDIYEKEFSISTTNQRSLVIGAAAREIRKYNANPFIHYYVYGKENKDYDRIVKPALTDIVSSLKKKAHKRDSRIFIQPDKETQPRGVLKRYHNMSSILADYVNLHKMPDNIHLDLIEAPVLLFEDSIYNFDYRMLCETFDKTGANIAYGYAMLPLDLIFPEMPENQIYKYTRAGSNAYMTFRGGTCNGYAHKHNAWATLLTKPVYSYKGVTIAIEITARLGPACVFKIYRCQHPELIVRTLELPTYSRYVKLLDIDACVNKSTGKVNYPLKYFSVCEAEFYDTLNYMLSIDEKSQTFATITAFVRRKMGGVSLITKELVKKWDLQPKDVKKFCLVVLIYVKMVVNQNETIRTEMGVGNFWEKIRTMIRTSAVVLPLVHLMEWIFRGHLTDKLVLTPEGAVIQLANITRVKSNPEHPIYSDYPNEDEVPACDLCFELCDRLGEQKVICRPGVAEVTLALSQDAVDEMKTALINNDLDPIGLKSVKERCVKSMPKNAFSRMVRVHYIKAGPGCGKSHLIRQLATTSDLILAPFTRLKSDYENLTAESGDKYNLTFKTTHRAMESRGCKRIFVDEFTSLPYEYLACIAEVNAAEEIFLVGDDRQTKVREPDEGKYIGNYIDLNSVPTHELIVNFRNPRDIVALLNRTYGYTMECKSNIERSINVLQVTELDINKPALRMAFSHSSAKLNTENEDNTIRSNQGKTTKDAVLYATNLDGLAMQSSELTIVGISRHTDSLTIVTDKSEASEKFLTGLDLSEDFYKDLDQYIPIVTVPTLPETGSRRVVDDFITQPDRVGGFDNPNLRDAIPVAASVELQPRPTVAPIGHVLSERRRTLTALNMEDKNEYKRALTGLDMEGRNEYWRKQGEMACALDQGIEMSNLDSNSSFKRTSRKSIAKSSETVFRMGVALKDYFTPVNTDGLRDDSLVEQVEGLMDDNFDVEHGKSLVAESSSSGLLAVGASSDLGKDDKASGSAGELVATATVSFVAEAGGPTGSAVGNDVENLKESGHRDVTLSGEVSAGFVFEAGARGISEASDWRSEYRAVKGKVEFKESETALTSSDSGVNSSECGLGSQSSKPRPILKLEVTTTDIKEDRRVVTPPISEEWYQTFLKSCDFDEGKDNQLVSTTTTLFPSTPPVVVSNPSLKTLPQETGDFVVDPSKSVDPFKNFDNKDFCSHMETMMQFPREQTRPTKPLPEPLQLEKPLHPSHDAYLLTETLLPSAATYPEVTSLNQFSSTVVTGDFRTGVVELDSLTNPVNKRHHPINMTAKYWSMGAGVGNYFSGKNPCQTLAVLGARYFGKTPHYSYGDSERLLVRRVVDAWFDVAVVPGASIAMMDDQEIQSIIDGFINKVTTQSYQSAFAGMSGLDNPDGRVIRFQLKGIFKPKHGTPDLYKAGQGISAWSVDACAMFCSIYRVLTKLVSKTERENIITDAYMTEADFVEKVKVEFSKTPEVALNGVTDGETFDANQNEFTQALEREYWTRLGVDTTFLDLYYSFRKNYKVVSSVAIGRALTQKTSGEPGTLVNNGIVSKLVSNYILKGDGPMATVYKGDDYCKRQCNIRTDPERLLEINGACNLRLKTNIGTGAEFCGLIYYNKYLFPSIPRKLNKIAAHRFRDYKHFTQYQEALRDWANKITSYGEPLVVACNAELYKTTIAEMDAAYDAIKSMGHIREDQFRRTFQYKEEIPVYPTMDKHGNVKVDF